MIVAAALCPCPPLLARELTGQEEVLPELRAACAAAVARLFAAEPDVLVVAGPDDQTGTWPPDGRLDFAAYAPAVARRLASSEAPWPALGTGALAAARRPALPLSLGMGALLLDEAGYAGPRAFHGIDAAATPDECRALGRQFAASAQRVALLAMGDGSARRSTSAPGYLDERAAPFDSAVERAVREGDLAALASLDPGLAADLLAIGRPAWQALAGAMMPSRVETEVLYCEAPLGVSYLVATLIPN
ncbi:MAG TPA: hypothetical protein VN714_34400 [Trebonia sp.]|nr:hypothetical protein [Trebonia sp.]